MGNLLNNSEMVFLIITLGEFDLDNAPSLYLYSLLLVKTEVSE